MLVRVLVVSRQVSSCGAVVRVLYEYSTRRSSAFSLYAREDERRQQSRVPFSPVLTRVQYCRTVGSSRSVQFAPVLVHTCICLPTQYAYRTNTTPPALELWGSLRSSSGEIYGETLASRPGLASLAFESSTVE